MRFRIFPAPTLANLDPAPFVMEGTREQARAALAQASGVDVQTLDAGRQITGEVQESYVLPGGVIGAFRNLSLEAAKLREEARRVISHRNCAPAVFRSRLQAAARFRRSARALEAMQ